MSNHYHLALETPEPNLSEGMRWLQSTFAVRFNKLRREHGHIFQGRFKSIVLEDMDRLGWLTHYIHLNPVRAGICGVGELREFRYSSFPHLFDKRKRPPFLDLKVCLESAGLIKDTPAGRRKYGEYLQWLSGDEPRQKAMSFETMSKGWAMGSGEFKKALIDDEKNQRACMELGANDAREMREIAWESKLEECLTILGKGADEIGGDKKSAPWKIAAAGYLKTKMLCRNGWLAERLNMGTEYAVSRYVTEMLNG